MISSKKIWLILASTTKADIYEVFANKYSLVKSLEHPSSKLKATELSSDRAGSYQTSEGGYGQFSPANDPHEEEHNHFAKKLADYLESARQNHCFEGIVICAEPHFKGLLNTHLSKQLCTLLIKSIDKNYIPLPQLELTEVLDKLMWEIR